jgi:hypothetical protein
MGYRLQYRLSSSIFTHNTPSQFMKNFNKKEIAMPSKPSLAFAWLNRGHYSSPADCTNAEKLTRGFSGNFLLAAAMIVTALLIFQLNLAW